jgi:hypothetical protein
MIPTSKQSASAGSSKATVRGVTLALFPTTLLLIMHPLVSTFKKPAATTTIAASLMSGSTLQLQIARRLVYWDTVKRVQTVLSFMRMSVLIFPTRVLVPMVTNVDLVTYIVRPECGKPSTSHQRGHLLRRVVPRSTSMILQVPKHGLGAPRRTLSNSLNRLILFHSMLTIEHAFNRHSRFSILCRHHFSNLILFCFQVQPPVTALHIYGRSLVRFAESYLDCSRNWTHGEEHGAYWEFFSMIPF